MTMPTINELLRRLKADVRGSDEMRELYRRVACGERHPTNPPLPGNVVILAAQAMTILFDHVDKTEPVGDCPHAAPHRYCDGCKVSPCPIGLG